MGNTEKIGPLDRWKCLTRRQMSQIFHVVPTQNMHGSINVNSCGLAWCCTADLSGNKLCVRSALPLITHGTSAPPIASFQGIQK